jgi:type I restriction enzyme S subunit
MKAVEGWETKRLDEIGTIFSGSTPSTSIRSFWDGEIVWVTPNDLSKLNTPYLHDSAKRITEKGLSACSTNLLPAGSLVMSSRAPIGYVALPTVQFCTNQGCKTIKLKSAFHPEFAYYNVLFNIHKIKNLGEGTTFAEISKTALSTIEVSFPTSLREQAKIAEILSTVDRAIDQTEALIAKQQRIKTGLMQDLLTRGIDEHGNLRSEKSHKFKDSPLGRIPVEWEVVETRKVCSLITKGTTPKLRSAESPRYSIPYLRVQNLTFSGQIDFSEDIAFIDCATHEGELARSKVFPGDVLQNIVGPPLGKIGIVPSDYPEWNINQAISLFRPNEAVSSEFLSHWLQVPATQTWFDINSKKTSGQQNLTLEHCQELPIVLPSLEEQTRICRLLGRLVVSQRTGVNELQKLLSLKTALMQALLTGKKRVSALISDVEAPL